VGGSDVPSSFVHLHVHSEYSILDSSCKISRLLDQAQALQMDALALTDHGVMSGVIKFYRQAMRRNISRSSGARSTLHRATEGIATRSLAGGITIWCCWPRTRSDTATY
jgi:DNA polymerase III alpha subunit